MGGAMLSKSLIQFSVEWVELCSLPAIYLGPGGSDGKASVYNVGDLGSIPGFDPWVGKIPWRREKLLMPVFWPGKFHGLYRPWGRKESDSRVVLAG